MKNKRSHKSTRTVAASVIVAFVVIMAGASISPVLAATMGNVPVVGSPVKVLTFREYTMDDDTYHASVKTPAVEGLESSKPLENSPNRKYMEKNKKLYEQFEVEVAELKKDDGEYPGVDSGYGVKCNGDAVLSIGHYVVNVVDSSSTTMKYDTIDKKNQMLITLPSLFKDEQYVKVISKNIRQQMVNQNKADSDKIYWVEGIDAGEGTELFQNTSAKQSFYINTDRELVVSFDKHEVVPGYIGVVDLAIPTNLIRDLLVDNDYIR